MSETIGIWIGEADLYAKARPAPPPVLIDILTQLARVSQPALVVDLGCGTGLSTRLWHERAQRVIGIEPNADMRAQAQQQLQSSALKNIEYRDGLSSETGLPSTSADIITYSQSLHWMEPVSTFAEAGRILRPGGVFAAYDYDLPPLTHWEVGQIYQQMMERFRSLRKQRGFDSEVKSWAKEQHLARMRESGQFRFLTEITLHHQQEGNAEHFIAFILSTGFGRFLKQGFFTEEEVGFDQLRETAHTIIGEQPVPWHWSYRARIGVR